MTPEIRARVEAACEQAVQDGHNLLPDFYGIVFSQEKARYVRYANVGICPLGATLLYAREPVSNDLETALCALLGVGGSWIWAFTRGFDGEGVPNYEDEQPEPAAFAFGRELREKYAHFRESNPKYRKGA